ncbi:hypothetical protein TNCV_1787291 [Trichonephila clavipes]|nr:hypothetical protein TNCV_1787291 [Trichonephila clavipes]
MRARAYWANPSIRGYWALRCYSRYPDQNGKRALPWIERTWEESPGSKEREESPKGRRTDIGVEKKERR